MVEPRKATSRRPDRGSSPRCRVKSPTTAATSTPGYSAVIAAPAACSTDGSTSQGTNRRSVPASRSASSSRRSEEHTSELQSRQYLVCRLLLEKKKYDNPTLGRSQLSSSTQIFLYQL